MSEIMNGFFRGKRVLVTGHTGFKGSWLSLWLHKLGAEVMGFAQNPPTVPSHYEAVNIAGMLRSQIGDIRDYDSFSSSIRSFQPEIVFHLAAQALVRYSYTHPIETYSTNVMGTVHILDACRRTPDVKAVIVVTSDKCYELLDESHVYQETDPVGGYDPYSSSKGCAELVTAAYRRSFFHDEDRIGLATVRAGNVIGGGDWGIDRLIPDCIRAFSRDEPVKLRFPDAVRPWQHVLEPLSGYLQLASRLVLEGKRFSGAWNFGPDPGNVISVRDLVERVIRIWNHGGTMKVEADHQPHEARTLLLDSSKARGELGWQPLWNMDTALINTVDWYKKFYEGKEMRDFTLTQIDAYQRLWSDGVAR